MNFLLYLYKWVNKYGIVWSIKNIGFLRLSYIVLIDINKFWGNDEQFERFLYSSELNTNFSFVNSVISARINERGINYSSALQKIFMTRKIYGWKKLLRKINENVKNK